MGSAPRIPVRLRVQVAHLGDEFAGETRDFGPGGCLVVAPKIIAPGSHLRLAIESDSVSERLNILGGAAALLMGGAAVALVASWL